MFNRTLHVKLVKTKKETPVTSVQEISLEGKVAIIGHYAERAVKKAGQAIVAYVVVDTLRQVIVAKALKS